MPTSLDGDFVALATETLNRSAEQHRRTLAQLEVDRLRETMKVELALTNTRLEKDNAAPVLWSARTTTVVFRLHVSTINKDGLVFFQVLAWQSGNATEHITAAIQQNLQNMQRGEHAHATFPPRSS